ncbi:MAG: Rne/Rng family ribonuclease [Planctomycetota bacterium]|nr:Rne/Rng family ribonuclease [Planctomycetota bacterium]
MKDTSSTGAGDTAAPREDRDSASRARAKSSPRDASAEKSSAGGFGEGLEGKASSPKKTTKKTTRRRPKAKPDASDSAPASSSSDGGASSDEAGAKLDRRRNRSSASVKAAKAKSAEGNDAGEKPKRPRRPRKRAAARADSDSQEPQNDGDRDSGANESSDAPKRPRRKRGSRKSKAPRGSSDQDGGEAAAESSESSEDSPREEGTSKRRRGARGGRRKKASGDLAKDQDASERKPRSRSKKKVKVKKRGRRTRKDSVRNQPVAMEFLPGEEDDLPELTALPEDAELVEESGRKGRRKTKKKGEKGVTTTTIKDVPRDQVILVNAVDKLESRVALVHEKRIHDLYLEVNRVQSYVHNIYRGKVVNIEAAIGAAFVDFGQGKNGFLHVSDVLPEYGEKGWDLSKLLEAREGPNDDVDLSGVESDEEAEGKSRKNSKGRGRKERSGKRPMIGDLLKVGDKVAVQITKDAIGDKGPALTTYVSIPGRYLVLMPSLEMVGVSRKIEEEKERRRLRKILKSFEIPGGMGLIVRTAGIGKPAEDLRRDLEYLLALWESFSKRLVHGRTPTPLYQENDLAVRTMRDLFSRRTKKVVVDDEDVCERMRDFARKLMPEHVERIVRHDGARPLFHDYDVEQDYEKIFSRRVELPSGGSIVIDQTEALVAIDVNSGRTREDGAVFEDIALKANLEAVAEIALQIRLRDLGGILVLDFIDMMRKSSRLNVERSLREALHGDRARHKVGRISQFGLLELTRQRLGPGLSKLLYTGCLHCRGTGRERTPEARAQGILRRLGSALTQKGFSKVEIRTQPEVVEYLKRTCKKDLGDLSETHKRELVLVDAPEQLEESVLRYLRTDGREVRPGGRRKKR